MQSTKTTIKVEPDQQAVKRPNSNYSSVLESNVGPGSSESLNHSDNGPDVSHCLSGFCNFFEMFRVQLTRKLKRRTWNSLTQFWR